MSDRIDFPPWVPRAVRDRAEELYAAAAGSGSTEDAKTVQELSVDPRLKSIWDQLKRKRRIKYQPTEAFFLPAYDPMSSFIGHKPVEFRSRAEWMQQLAMAHLFERLVHWTRISKNYQQTNLSRPYDDVSERLKQIASEFSKIKSPARMKQFKLLTRTARLLDAEGAAVNKMELGTNPLRSATIGLIARNLEALFGSPSYGVAATLATMALKEKITPQQVRDAWKGIWGKGLQNRSSRHRVQTNRR